MMIVGVEAWCLGVQKMSYLLISGSLVRECITSHNTCLVPMLSIL